MKREIVALACATVANITTNAEASASTLFYKFDITNKNPVINYLDVILGVDSATRDITSATGIIGGTQQITSVSQLGTGNFLDAALFDASDPGSTGFIRANFNYGVPGEGQSLELFPSVYHNEYIGFCIGGSCSIDPLSSYNATTTLTPVPNGAVPEPTTWAMMIGGFGMAGAALRQRRRIAFSFA